MEAHIFQGQSPVTTAEFILSKDTDQPDDYEISLVNGFNMPMRIDNSANCGVPECSVDLGANCQFSDEVFYDLSPQPYC
ncbi:hypothetical protein EI94DRAFT_1803464 [Lactarius quietus]|nr:hypothetical protein EI94DRAFT_1803464 [Lactarius quietus]